MASKVGKYAVVYHFSNRQRLVGRYKTEAGAYRKASTLAKKKRSHVNKFDSFIVYKETYGEPEVIAVFAVR